MKSTILNALESSLTAATGKLRRDVYRALTSHAAPSIFAAEVEPDERGLRVGIHLSAGECNAVSFTRTVSESVVPTATRDNLRPIVELFERASGKLKYPKIHFTMPDGRPLSLVLGGARSRFPGSVNITDGGRYGSNVWYGRIHRDGRYERSKSSDESIGSFLSELAENPAEAAARHGRRTGKCCFCNARLTDERSTIVGYGPVCAESFGLPWGKKGCAS